jgi:hypothetical protein
MSKTQDFCLDFVQESASAHFNSKLQKAATASATEEARKLAHLQTL